MALRQRLRRFLIAGIEHDGDIFLLRRLLLITSLLTMIIFLFSFFTVYNLLYGDTKTGLLDLGGLLICLTAMYQLQRNKRLELAVNIVVVALFGFLLLFANVNQNNSYGLIWTFFFPVFTVLLKGQRVGSWIVFAFYLLLLPFAYHGIGSWQGGAWDLTSFIRFSLASLVIYYSAYFNELSLQRSYNELRKTTRREQAAAKQHTEEVMQLLENKQQLMVDISHELRTPLAAMRVNLEAFEDGILGRQEAFPLLQHKVAELNQLIEDIYQLSRADVGALVFKQEPVPLLPLLEEVVAGYQQPAVEKQIQLSFASSLEQNLCVTGDEARLQQLLCNLLQNSLRYTDAGGQLQLSAEAKGGEVELLLQDSAPGVGDVHLPRLFERFYRVDKSRSRAHGGSGLGLAICKIIVENHGGTIGAAHSPLGGLQIRITLPVTTGGN